MQRAQTDEKGGQVSEMAIVDTFTKLIFGEDSQYSNRELMIIQAFRMVDPNVVFDSHRDMGAYLQALGVREMVQLVSRVRQQLGKNAPLLSPSSDTASTDAGAHDRRVH